jgi:cysteinyl-tRNA synthetase
VEPNPQKRNPTDFALWKFSPTDKKRDMEWESPWGMGFPGWHIECSAMSRTHLGDQIDIHTGGVDLIPVHHTNEIAQSEASSGKSPFVRYWVHGQFLLVDGKKMAKSKGNFYKLSDIEARKIDPLALRYFYMTAHYRAYLNFTWEALGSAQNALNDLHVSKPGRESLSADKLEKIDRYRERFDEALRNDMNMPQAIAIAWEVRKSNIPERDKYDLLMDFDEVLGLDLGHIVQKEIIPEEIRTLVQMRDEYRKKKMFSEADEVRKRIEERGFQIDDSADGEPVISRVR